MAPEALARVLGEGHRTGTGYRKGRRCPRGVGEAKEKRWQGGWSWGGQVRDGAGGRASLAPMGISFLSSLLFTSLLFTAICKASLDSHFVFLHFFSMAMVLIPVSYTVS